MAHMHTHTVYFLHITHLPLLPLGWYRFPPGWLGCTSAWHGELLAGLRRSSLLVQQLSRSLSHWSAPLGTSELYYRESRSFNLQTTDGWLMLIPNFCGSQLLFFVYTPKTFSLKLQRKLSWVIHVLACSNDYVIIQLSNNIVEYMPKEKQTKLVCTYRSGCKKNSTHVYSSHIIIRNEIVMFNAFNSASSTLALSLHNLVKSWV